VTTYSSIAWAIDRGAWRLSSSTISPSNMMTSTLATLERLSLYSMNVDLSLINSSPSHGKCMHPCMEYRPHTNTTWFRHQY